MSRVVSYLPERVEKEVTARRAAVVVLDSFNPRVAGLGPLVARDALRGRQSPFRQA
jgi:hypothetical protein